MMTIKEIRGITNLSQSKFSEKYKIPKRTIENWEAGTTKPPDYVVMLLEKVVKQDFNFE